MAKSKPNKVAFSFGIVSSLVFLVLLISLVSGVANGSITFSQVVQADNAFWLPVLYGAAVIGTLTLFAVSFSYLGSSDLPSKYATCVSIANGAAWVVIASGNVYFTAIAVGAFLLSLVSSFLAVG